MPSHSQMQLVTQTWAVTGAELWQRVTVTVLFVVSFSPEWWLVLSWVWKGSWTQPPAAEKAQTEQQHFMPPRLAGAPAASSPARRSDDAAGGILSCTGWFLSSMHVTRFSQTAVLKPLLLLRATGCLSSALAGNQALCSAGEADLVAALESSKAALCSPASCWSNVPSA